MSTYFNPNKIPTREDIIGLGQSSIRKNYYPELQEKNTVLEKMRSRNQALIMAIPDILLVSDPNCNLTPFFTSSNHEGHLVLHIIRREEIVQRLNTEIRLVYTYLQPRDFTFDINIDEIKRFFEARLHLTEQNEVLIIIRDMTERISMENKLRDLAETDYLTGLMNREKYENMLSCFDGMVNQTLGLIIFDIDGLKGINDTFGHYEGDRVIRLVALKISEIFEDALYIARVGGNEFSVVYKNVEQRFLEERCDQFRKAIEVYNTNHPYSFTVSYGISHSAGKQIMFKELYQVADHNMYSNKLLKNASSKSVLVRTLMNALEAKDYITEGHAERMTQNARHLGKILNLEQHRLDHLTLLTKFHDLGKIGIPDSILKKPAPLTPDEWRIMETHTTIGQHVASVSAELKPISELILLHHEKWDGTGYPLGLCGDSIPLECRILSLVDAFDAMTNDRPYRTALSKQHAISEIENCSGKQFDPYLVELFCNHLNKFVYAAK